MAGGSARAKTGELRQQAIDKRIEADRLDHEADAWAAGAEGEERVALALKAVEGPSCRVLHDRLINPGRSRANLDHIVVSPAGVFLIDAKNWAGDVTVYQDGLWQHRTVDGERVHLPKTGELDQVRRFAEELAATGGCPVEPVICLAGDRSAQFGDAVRLRGVWVVPHGRISTWLLNRPLVPMPTAPATLAVQLSARFPSATDPNPGFADWTAAGNPPAARRAPKAGQARRAHRKRRAPSLGRIAVAAIALAMLVFVLPRAMRTVGPAVGNKIASQLLPQTATWQPPCGSVPTATLAKDLGRPLYSYGPPVHEVCKWSFTARPTAGRPADLILETGWFAQQELGKSTATSFVRIGGSLRLQVPQHARPPGSPTSRPGVPQPMAISLQIGKIPSATARKALTLAAGQLAGRLPTGPGADVVKLR